MGSFLYQAIIQLLKNLIIVLAFGGAPSQPRQMLLWLKPSIRRYSNKDPPPALILAS